jgi:glycosyltransferase involved in cell wall biosynthesis
MAAAALRSQADQNVQLMGSQPSFSIVIPTFQRRESVCVAVGALAKLRYAGKFEVIVVIDGSSDGTAAALTQLGCPFPLRLVEQANAGQAAARNRGAAEAAGEIILFLDDDMIAEPDLLAQHAESHRAGADAVTGEVPVHPESPPGLVTDALMKAAAWHRDPPASPFHVYSGNLSVSKRVFDEVGGFDEQFCLDGYGGEDLDFGLRLVGPYELRHNKAAVAWQRNSIGPREHMRRARKLAESDLRLIAKHPAVAAELLAARDAPPPGKSSRVLRLSRLPLLPNLAGLAAAWLAEIGSKVGFRSNSALARFYFSARSLAYWSALRKQAGAAALRQWLDR